MVVWLPRLWFIIVVRDRRTPKSRAGARIGPADNIKRARARLGHKQEVRLRRVARSTSALPAVTAFYRSGADSGCMGRGNDKTRSEPGRNKVVGTRIGGG